MLRQFIIDNQHADVAQLALQRKRYPMISDSDFRFCIQQIDGWQRTKDKLPTFAHIDGWLYPPRLNLEQCSSERTARFKAALVEEIRSQKSEVRDQKSEIRNQKSEVRLIDGTGGYGVDSFFMSEVAAETHYFEQNAELAAIAEHNFHLAGKTIQCHAEAFTVQSLQNLLAENSQPSAFNSQLIYLDPARRDTNGGKVFRLEDCTPNVIEIVQHIRLIRSIREQQVSVLLKLSPMLDFHQAVAELGGSWEVYVVSVNGEVKELLLADIRSQMSEVRDQKSEIRSQIAEIHAVALDDEGEHDFAFTPEEESEAEVLYLSADETLEGLYVYEPDAALLKAGAFRLISARYGLRKAAQNTHLYFVSQKSNAPLCASLWGPRAVESQMQKVEVRKPEISGRWWQVVGVYARVKDVQRVCTRANVLTRNYVLSADALRKQLHLKDGGEDYIIGCRINDKPLLLHCRRGL